MRSASSVICEVYRNHGRANGDEFFAESLKANRFKQEDVQLVDLAKESFGDDWRTSIRQRAAMRGVVRESIESVTPDVFSAVAGQLMMTRIRESFMEAVAVTDNLVEIVPNPNGNLGTHTEEIPGTTTESDLDIKPGMAYPKSGLATNVTVIPEPIKRGLICYLSEEAVYTNNSRTALKMAKDCGTWLGTWVEKERMKVILGVSGTWSFNGTSYATYATAGALYNNALDNLDIIDDVTADTLLQLFALMRHPNRTNEPIMIDESKLQVLVHRAKKIAGQNAFFPDLVRQTTQANVQVERGVVTDGDVSLYISNYVDSVLADAGLTSTQRKTYVVAGNFKEAFGWREVYPLQTFEANASATDLTPSGPLGERDIVFASKARVFGRAFVQNPFKVVRSRVYP